MIGKLSTRFSNSDILFLVEITDPRLMNKIDTIKGYPAIIEGMLGHGVGETGIAGKPYY